MLLFAAQIMVEPMKNKDIPFFEKRNLNPPKNWLKNFLDGYIYRGPVQ